LVLEYVPGSQSRQSVEPPLLLYRPAVHVSQRVAFTYLVPGGQGLQTALLANVLTVPISQSMHSVCPVVFAYLPAPQSSHVQSVFQYRPVAHGTQTVRLAAGTLPCSQAAQGDMPSKALNVPSGHGSHTEWLKLD
jgi:hypothetical protein